MKNVIHGFTLIELLVVILIIGILAAIALPQYQKAVEHSRIIAALPLLKSVYNAQKIYYLEHGQYATSAAQLEIDFACPQNALCAINQSVTGSEKGYPKIEIKFKKTGVTIILYYGAKQFSSIEVEGKPYCCSVSSDKRAVQLCKSFGPVFSTELGWTRVFINP